MTETNAYRQRVVDGLIATKFRARAPLASPISSLRRALNDLLPALTEAIATCI